MSGSQTWSLGLTTPLGPDALTLERLEGEEYISQTFLLRLAMHAKDPVDATALLGKGACVTLIDGDGNHRYLHGLVTRFVQREQTCDAELRPWLWMLSLCADNRIFQNKSVPDIVTAVFDGAGFSDYRRDLKLTYPSLEYCVQFQESHFAFVSRLLEEVGICYFFEHSDSAHTLVLADDPATFKPCAHAESIPFAPQSSGRDFLEDLRIDSVASEHQVAVQAYQTDDFNFVTPATDLKTSTGSGARLVYEYPGRFTTKDAGETVAKRRIEAFEATATQLSGASPVRALCAGGSFTMTGHPDSALNQTYALRAVAHSAARREYANRFTAFPGTIPFRPPHTTPAPRVGGSQTAMVVGPSGKEIYTDQYGRVKVQFHWDQLGKRDENSSCWIRVAQNWAGVSWGAFSLPRIGQEVVVTFLNGDPDRPLITGCVYNGDNPVPYALPDEQTKTVLKSNTSEGGGGFNELRLEDKKDSEEIYVHAAKDMTVEVVHDRAVTVQQGNETLTVSEGDRTIAVSKGKETHSVAATRAMTVTGAETRTNKADFSQKVSGNFTLTVDGDITIKAAGALVLQSGTGLTVKAGTELAQSAGTSAEMKAGTGVTLQAGTSVTVKAGASASVDGGGMLALKGGIVQVN